MKFSPIALLIILLAPFTVFAQDVILQQDSSVIQGQVLEVSEAQIKYKKSDNPDGPVFILDSKKVIKIDFQNGTVHEFEHRDKYGRDFRTNMRIHKKRQTVGIVLGSLGIAGMITGGLVYSNRNYGAGAFVIAAGGGFVIAGGITLGTSVKYLKRARELKGETPATVLLQPKILDVQGYKGAIKTNGLGYGLGLAVSF